jgi:hypothetical protein
MEYGMTNKANIDLHDRTVLRELAKEVVDIAAQPVIHRRRERWVAHNSLRSNGPLMLVFPEGSWEELILAGDLHCTDETARAIEWELRRRIYTFRHFQDDSVIEAEWVVDGKITNTGWGLEPLKVPSSDAHGAFRIVPVLRERSDIKKLRLPELVYDEVEHQHRLAEMEDLFGDLLNVRRKGVAHISYHLWSQYLYLRGETDFLTDFIDAPDMVDEVMAFFVEGHKRLLAQMIERNLLSLNNDNTYHSSGGNGYTGELPAPGFNVQQVRPCDMWASAESQELQGVSPAMQRRFAMQYEKELLAPFGLTGYGCCEDLSRKLYDVLTLPHMRRISISPFAEVERCAEVLQGRAIFSWKPQPAHLVGRFDAEAIRAYVRHTLDACKANGCVLEIILKDTHTCEHHPERFDEWTRIAREEILSAAEV